MSETIEQKKYREQHASASQRGIEWKLTFDEWWNWWQQTGHWHERGTRKGQYVMCRFGDVGPYALDNIFCGTVQENCAMKNQQKRKCIQTPNGQFESFRAAVKATGLSHWKLQNYLVTQPSLYYYVQ